MDQQSKNQSEYSFLTNVPSGKDLFKNQSQEKIASVLAEKIISDPNFKIIGIDGTWGSGKSNLVKLIESKLGKDYRFFIYDVWGHQEDEQRKAILVELTDFIREPNNKLVSNKNDWEKKLKILLANSKETTTINQPYLSIGFVFSLLSIVYVPTVNVFKDNMSDYLKIESFFGKLLLIAFPLFIVLFLFLYYFLINLKSGFKKSIKLAAGETFQVYTNKQKEETKIETISESQPSVRDFRNWMDDIDKDLKSNVVIVFDNFDRLPKKHILNIWSSIHIFFAEKNYDKIKVLLPFDRKHVQNAFSDLDASDDVPSFADDYINKTFDIVFRISLPIMSDWKNFFRIQWKEAFKKFDEEEMERVIQAYEFLNKRGITPREIIALINEILTIKSLDSMYMERYIAIFILLKDQILENPLASVTNFKYLEGLESLYRHDENFPKQMTAIIYQIQIDGAFELIFTEQLKDALNKRDITVLNDICSSECINDILFKSLDKLEEYPNPIRALNEMDKESSKLSEHNLKQAWRMVYGNVLSSRDKISNLEIEDWQIILLNEQPDDSRYLQSLVTSYYDLLDGKNALQFVSLVDVLVEQIGSDRVKKHLVKKFIQPVELTEIVSLKGQEYKDYQLACSDTDLDSYLVKLPIEELIKIANTDVLFSDYVLSSCQKELEKNFKDAIQQNNFQMANDIMFKLRDAVKTNGILKGIITDERIYSAFFTIQSTNLPLIYDLIAMRIAFNENFNASYVPVFETALNGENEDLVLYVGRVILNYIKYDELLLLASKLGTYNLYKALIFFLIGNEDINKGYDMKKVILNYGSILIGLKILDDTLFKEIGKWEIKFEDIDLNKLPNAFIEDCFKYLESDLSKAFVSEFNRKFVAFSEDEMKVLFKDVKNVYNRYFINLEDHSLNQSSLNVFKDIFISDLKGKTDNEVLWRILQKYDSIKGQVSVQNLLKDIKDGIFNSSIEITSETACKLIPYFIKYNILKNQNEVFRKLIKAEFLGDEEFVKLLIANSNQIGKIFRSAEEKDKLDFQNTVIERTSVGNEYEHLAKMLNLNTSEQSS